MSNTQVRSETAIETPRGAEGRHEAQGRHYSCFGRRSAPSAFTATWVGGSTPTSRRVTSWGRTGSRVQARPARSSSARESRRPCRARHRDFILLGLQEIEWVVLRDHSGGSMMETGFLEFGAASDSGMMRHGTIGQATAAAVGWVFVRGVSCASDGTRCIR